MQLFLSFPTNGYRTNHQIIFAILLSENKFKKIINVSTNLQYTTHIKRKIQHHTIFDCLDNLCEIKQMKKRIPIPSLLFFYAIYFFSNDKNCDFFSHIWLDIFIATITEQFGISFVFLTNNIHSHYSRLSIVTYIVNIWF